MASHFRPPVKAAAKSSSPPWLLIFAVALAAYFLPSLRGCDFRGPQVAPPAGPNLVEAFKTNDNRTEARGHAHQFATICATIADCLEYDGGLTEPRIKTGVQIDELRRTLRQMRMKGFSFLTRYPGLEKPLEEFLTTQVGTSGGPVDKPQRDKWIAAMRTLAASAEFAAR